MKDNKAARQMLRETAILSMHSVILQGFGLLLNVFLTRRLGAASVGMLSLMGSFYGLAAVLSGGSGFIAASRFLSEEIGGGGNPRQVFRYVLRFCLTLSGIAAAGICILANPLAVMLAKTGASPMTLRLLGITLPIAAAAACLKGRCYAYRRVYFPAIAECADFLLRAGTMAFCTVFCIPSGRLPILTAFALSVLIGQGSALAVLMMCRMPQERGGTAPKLRLQHFLRLQLPIIGNACIVAMLGSANDALVPLTLRQFGKSTEEALAAFGEFEAIIIPTLFFPSVVQCCMSALMVPALSRCRAEGNEAGLRSMTQRVFRQTVSFSLFVVLMLLLFGNRLGVWLGGDAFTGQILRVMAPVVPFIYIEIILEGILRGLGRQGCSTLNYLAEYTVRISVLLICVPLFGFYGIVMSYLACNITGNAVRIYMVLRFTGLKPDWKQILLYPLIALTVSWQISKLMMHFIGFLHMNGAVSAVLYALICGGLYLLMLCVLQKTADTAPVPGKRVIRQI